MSPHSLIPFHLSLSPFRGPKARADHRLLRCFVCSKLGVKVVDVEDIDTYEGVLSPIGKTPGGRHLKL